MPSKINHDFAPDGTEVKRCSRCNIWKRPDEYTKNKSKSDGFCDKCKTCLKEYRHERLEHNREYMKNNLEKRRVWIKNAYNRKKENPDEKFIQKRLKENIAICS